MVATKRERKKTKLETKEKTSRETSVVWDNPAIIVDHGYLETYAFIALFD